MATQLKVQLVADPDADSPRKWDNLGVMVGAHRRYEIGDEDGIKKSVEFIRERFNDERLEKMGFDETNVASVEQALLLTGKVILLPLYLYDHSGLALSTNPFSCPFDSGKVGYIWVSKARVMAEYGGDWLTKEATERARNCLIGEVETYHQYLSGDVWGFRVLDQDGDEVDSCWGFYGDDPMTNGMTGNLSDEAKQLIEAGKFERLYS